MALALVTESETFAQYIEPLLTTFSVPTTLHRGSWSDMTLPSSDTPLYAIVPCDQSGTVLDPKTQTWLDTTFRGARTELREKVDALFQSYGDWRRPTYRIPIGSVLVVDHKHASFVFVPVQHVSDLRPPEHAVHFAFMAALYMVFHVRGAHRVRVWASVPDTLFWFDPDADPAVRANEIARACREFLQYNRYTFLQCTPTVIWADPLRTLEPFS